MKPGKPLTFATLETCTRGSAETRQVLVFGLPGNPVSSAVTFNLFAVPAIRLLSGWSKPNLRRCAFLTFQSNDEVHHAQNLSICVLTNSWVCQPVWICTMTELIFQIFERLAFIILFGKVWAYCLTPHCRELWNWETDHLDSNWHNHCTFDLLQLSRFKLDLIQLVSGPLIRNLTC